MEGIVSMWTQIIAGLGGMAATTFRISGILVVAWIVVAVGQRAIRTLRERIARRMDDRESHW